nr:hypothetical protein [Rhizobium sullae]
MNTTTSGGRLVFRLFGALAQFERDPGKNPRRAARLPRNAADAAAAKPP